MNQHHISRMKTYYMTLPFFVLFTALNYAQKDLDSLWTEVAFTKQSTCLLGTQYTFDREGERFKQTVFNKEPWQLLSQYDKQKTTAFLLGKLADTTKTNIHTCPFMGASNGELAVYALQQIHSINWYDFDEFSAYANRDITSATDSPQGWLLAILSDDSERKKLEALFRKLLD
ncbi:MAG: hypothetical protein AAFX55_06695 [Bacteroidota bacterium]